MHPLVRDLYKRVLTVGKDYPMGLDYVRMKAKDAFRANAGLTDEVEVKRAVNRGRWRVKEMIAVIQLRKYRQINKSYNANEDESASTSGIKPGGG
jgi:Complex 1 protein (LYR family)